jgi:hypothetical protein
MQAAGPRYSSSAWRVFMRYPRPIIHDMMATEE